MTNTELPALRKALDGLAFAAHQAGEQGRSVSECGYVADWIAEAMRAALAAQSTKEGARLYTEAELDAAVEQANARQNAAWRLMADKMVAAERERWATAARLCTEATPDQLPLALDALADVLLAQR